MSDPRIPLKNPWLAGLLAFLVPGAGHLYQGRTFKAGVYFVSIFGLFLLGMVLSGWQGIQTPTKEGMKHARGYTLLKFGAQAGIGIPFGSAMIQRQRYYDETNVQQSSISRPFSVPFEGVANFQDDTAVHNGPVSGVMYLEPGAPQFGKPTISGRFEGELSGKPIKFQLANDVQLAQPVDAEKRRELAGSILSTLDGRDTDIGHVMGTIPRPFTNWFAVPMDELEDQHLHDRLGKFYELAMVFTWVAGLLNVLAIWDAVEGPAYGYGKDENSPEPLPTA
jgi:hypothetical protein